MHFCVELASDVVVGKFANFAQARFAFAHCSGAAAGGSRFIGRSDSGYISESALESGGRSGVCSLRDLMASLRALR